MRFLFFGKIQILGKFPSFLKEHKNSSQFREVPRLIQSTRYGTQHSHCTISVSECYFFTNYNFKAFFEISYIKNFIFADFIMQISEIHIKIENTSLKLA